MSRAYEFAIKLRDLFTPQMMRLADQYERRTSWMSRVWDRFTGMLRSSSQTVDALRRSLSGLGDSRRLRIDSSDIDRADRKATGLLGKLRNLATSSTVLGGLVGGGVAGIAMGALDMVASRIGEIQEMTVGAAQRNESTMFNMVELMGKKVATNIVEAIDRYAPERRTELIDSAQKLAGAGVVPEKMMDTLTALNNIAALTNTSVSELAMIQAKIKATGYVQGDEINMFKERGINLNPYIAQVMGVREDQIAKLQAAGKITYDIFDKAMQAYAGAGGKYDGVYQRKRDSTVEGKEAALSGKWATTLADLGAKLLPLKESIIDLLSRLIDVAGPVFSFLVGLFEKVWAAIRPVWDGVLGLIGYFGGLMQSGGMLNIVLGVMGNMLDLVLMGVNAVAQLIGFLIDNPLTRLILMLWGASKAWMFLNAVIAANPIMAAITAVLALVAGVQYAWETFDGFREGVLRSWEMIKSVFSNVGEFLYKLFTLDFGGALAVLGRAISGGRAAGDRAVAADRKQRKDSRADQILASATTPQVPPGATTPTGPGGNPLAGAAGMNSSVGNAKSNNITINIASLIGRSEITVMDLQEGIDDIESKLIDALLRVANSGSRAVLS